jgi:hypothetical protein
MNADAELDPAFRRQPGVALDQAVLHFDGATHGIDTAAKFNETAVAGSLDDAPVMRVDGGIDQIAPKPPEPRQRAILVRSRETALSDDIDWDTDLYLKFETERIQPARDLSFGFYLQDNNAAGASGLRHLRRAGPSRLAAPPPTP